MCLGVLTRSSRSWVAQHRARDTLRPPRGSISSLSFYILFPFCLPLCIYWPFFHRVGVFFSFGLSLSIRAFECRTTWVIGLWILRAPLAMWELHNCSGFTMPPCACRRKHSRPTKNWTTCDPTTPSSSPTSGMLLVFTFF